MTEAIPKTAPLAALGAFDDGESLSAREIAERIDMHLPTVRNAVHRLLVWGQLKKASDWSIRVPRYELIKDAPALPARSCGDFTEKTGESLMLRVLRAFDHGVPLSRHDASLASGVNIITVNVYVGRLVKSGAIASFPINSPPSARQAEFQITPIGEKRLRGAVPVRRGRLPETTPQFAMRTQVNSVFALGALGGKGA